MDGSMAPGLLSDIAPEHAPAAVAALLVVPLLWLAGRGTARLADLGVPWARRYRVGRREATPMATTVAILLAVIAAIHLALVPTHWGDEPGTALLFLINGAMFAALAIALAVTSGWRRTTAALLVTTVLAYLFYIASGREDADQVGLATALLELLALGLVLLEQPAAAALGRPRWRLLATAGTVVGMTMLAGVVPWAASFRPSGDAGHPMAGMTMQATPQTASQQQQAAAAALALATRSGIARFADVRQAVAAGYRPTTPAQAPTVHYVNPTLARMGRPLDPAHPAALVYANTRHGLLLLGAMFMTDKPGVFGPAVGGPITPWHVHTNICFTARAAISGFASPFGQCPFGSFNVVTPAMLHVWTIPTPIGPFGDLPNWYVTWLDQR